MIALARVRVQSQAALLNRTGRARWCTPSPGRRALAYLGRPQENFIIKDLPTVHNPSPALRDLEHISENGEELAAVNADQMRRHRRVGQGSENIEDRPNADVAPRLHGILHRLMEQRRKQKSDADFRDALLDPFSGRIHFDAQSAQHVGAARLTRNRPIAMLRDIDAGARKQTPQSSDVEGSRFDRRPAQVSRTVCSPYLWAFRRITAPRGTPSTVSPSCDNAVEPRPPVTASLHRHI